MGRQRHLAAWFLGVDKVRPFQGASSAILASGRGFVAVAIGSLAFTGVYAAAWAGLNAAQDLESAAVDTKQIAAPAQPQISTNESPAATTLMVFQTPYEHNDGPVQIALTHRDYAPVGPAPATTATMVASAPQPIVAPDQPSIVADVATPGCISPLRQFAQDQIIRFQIGSAAVAQDAMTMLQQLGERAQSCPEAVIQVTGHSDSSGSDLINLALSWQRADNTLAALTELGHDTSAFSTIGFGDRQPLTEGDASDDALNRRVEFRVLSNTAGAG